MKTEVYEIPESISAPETEYLYLGDSAIIGAGQGLFTAILIYKNEIISLFKGEILDDTEAANRANLKLDGYFINMLDGKIMDSRLTSCFAKYANDAEGLSKSRFKNNAKIALDENDEVCLVALRNIKVDEEIFCGYGKKYWLNFGR